MNYGIKAKIQNKNKKKIFREKYHIILQSYTYNKGKKIHKHQFFHKFPTMIRYNPQSTENERDENIRLIGSYKDCGSILFLPSRLDTSPNKGRSIVPYGVQKHQKDSSDLNSWLSHHATRFSIILDFKQSLIIDNN